MVAIALALIFVPKNVLLEMPSPVQLRRSGGNHRLLNSLNTSIKAFYGLSQREQQQELTNFVSATDQFRRTRKYDWFAKHDLQKLDILALYRQRKAHFLTFRLAAFLERSSSGSFVWTPNAARLSKAIPDNDPISAVLDKKSIDLANSLLTKGYLLAP